MNCFQCRYCQLQPDTDFTRRGTQIYCGAPSSEGVIGRKPLNLSGCPSAVRMPGTGKGFFWNEASKAFLSTHWPLDMLDSEQICRVLNRPYKSVKETARNLGLHRHRRWLSKRLEIACKSQKGGFNAAQIAYVMQCVTDGSYPLGGGKVGGAFHTNENRKREAILKRVAELGHPFAWTSIRTIVYKSQASYLRRKGIQ